MRSTTAFVRPLSAVPSVIRGFQCCINLGIALNDRNVGGRFIGCMTAALG